MRGRLSPAKRAVFFRQFPQEVHVSGVYQRNREVSEYKFFTQAIAIRVEVNKLNLAGGGGCSMQPSPRDDSGGTPSP